MDVSTYLSVNALKMAQDIVAQVAGEISASGPSVESMTTLLMAENMHEANLNVIGITDEMMGNVIDIIG